MSIEWTTPKQVESRFRFFMPKDMRNWFVMAKWLRGHMDRVIEIIAAPIFTGDDLNPGEQLLTELPGVYRIARITEGSFGREGNDLVLGGPLVATPLDSWEKWLCVIFVVLAAVALVREIRRSR